MRIIFSANNCLFWGKIHFFNFCLQMLLCRLFRNMCRVRKFLCSLHRFLNCPYWLINIIIEATIKCQKSIIFCLRDLAQAKCAGRFFSVWKKLAATDLADLKPDAADAGFTVFTVSDEEWLSIIPKGDGNIKFK